MVFKPKPEEKPKITLENAQDVTKTSNVETIAKHILETHKVPTPIYTTPSRGIIFQVKKIYVGRKRKERTPKKNSKGKAYQQFRESQKSKDIIKSNDRDMITK